MGGDYKLTVTAKSATNLPNVEKNRDASDPYAIITFKSSKFKTKVIKNESSPNWDESHDFKVQELKPGDTLDVVFKDSETFGSDRTLAQCKVVLKDCLTKDVVEITTACSDAKNKKLDGCNFMCQVAYDGPKTKKGGGGGSGGGASGDAAASADATGDADAGGDAEAQPTVSADSDGAGRMPDEAPPPQPKKPSLRHTLPTKPMDYQIRVKVWEARQLKGGGLKPIVKLKIASQTKVTKVRKSNSPYWGEQFFFNFKMVPVQLFDENIEFNVNSANKFRSDAAIGSFKLDVGSAWDEDNHSILKKWLVLTEQEEGSGEVKGYLKISVMVLGAGDEAPSDPDEDGSGDGDIESNILRPAGCRMQPATFWCRLYRAVDLPQMDTGGFAAMKNFFTGDEDDERKQVDPFVIFGFAGKRVKSKVIYTDNEPKWNQQLQLAFNYPSMCQKLKFDVRDYDQLTGDDPIAVAELNLGAISVMTGEDGFLPTFGPGWVNLYGAPREEGTSVLGGSNEYLNVGKGEGCAYRGRIFIELGTKLGTKPEQPVLGIEDNQVLVAEKFSKTRKYRLFAYFEEANMITDSVDEPVQFEVSIGNFGNSMDPTGVKMPSTTQPIKPVFDGQHYYYIPFGDNKPTIAVDCEFEDIAYRMGPVNMAKRIITDVTPKVSLLKELLLEKSDDSVDREIATYIIDVLDCFKKTVPPLLQELKAIEHQGNSLDKKLTSYQIKQLELIMSTAEEEIENQTDFSNAIDNLEKFLTTFETLFSGAQCSIPDVVIWMIEDDSRIAYVRIPATEVFYHEKPQFKGAFCAKLHNVRLRFIGKRHKKKYKVPAQIRLKMWFGLQKDDKAWGSKHGEGNLSVVAETFEYDKYLPIVKWKDSDPPFADEFHKVALPKEDFKAPANWQFDGDWFVAVDKSMDVDPDEGLDEFYDDVFESQTHYPGQEWYAAKSPWVTMQGEETTSRDDKVPPMGWEYQDGWEIDTDRPVDEDGWEYCLDVDIGGWSSSEKPFHLWRRRRWVRLRKKFKESAEMIKAYKSEDPETIGYEYGKAMCNSWHSVESKLDTRRRRRWHRHLVPTNENAKPVFFFQFEYAPKGKKKKKVTVNIAPRTFISFKDPHKYELRFYLYQARDLLSADDEGYSDPYCRIVALNRSVKSRTIMKTVNPTYNQTLIFGNMKYYNDPMILAENPPLITVEVFDWDSIGTDDFLGRCDLKPLVKVDAANDHRVAQLEWVPVKKFGLPAGDILCSCELLLCEGDLPYKPPTDEKRKVFVVPSNVAPKLQRTAVEILSWGVRDLQKYQLSKVEKPEVEFEIGEFKKSTGKVKHIKECPNFESSVMYFEMMLPIEEKYMPPMNIKVKDNRQFGRRPTVASHRMSSLADYRIEPPKPLEASTEAAAKALDEDSTEVSVEVTQTVDITVDIEGDDEPLTKSSDRVPILKKTKPKSERSKSRDVQEKEETSIVPAKPLSKEDLKSKLPEGTDDTMDWWTKFYASQGDERSKEKAKEYIERNLDKTQILKHTLEKVEGVHMLQDFLQTFVVDEGKKEGDEEGDYMGQFKGGLVLYKLPDDSSKPRPPRFFQNLPSNNKEEILLRIYIIKGEDLQPMDDNGKSDPFVIIRCGKQKLDDEDHYIPNTINPVFGRMFEMNVNLPREKDLTIQVWDYDALSGNDIIGETVIDLEDRFLSKHRALCGLPQKYNVKGMNQWRDCQTPKEILDWYAKRNNLRLPRWEDEETVVVDGMTYTLEMFEKSPPNEDNGPEGERLALYVLNQFNLVKEHVERRPLYSPSQPDVAQGSLYMWVDMFPTSIGAPGPAFDVTPRDPAKYELRIVVNNTQDTELTETSITGEQMSDIYVKGWLEGSEHDMQKTDVHYRCMDGEGMFNWRFVFKFDYNPAEKRIVVKRKEHFWSMDTTEQYFPARLNLQVWDNDLISSDDVIGSLTMDLDKILKPAKDKKKCTLKQLEPDAPTISLFKQKRLKGFWPVFRDDETVPEGKVLSSKLDLEIELVCGEEEIESKPAAKARDDPNTNPTLEPPNRPATSFLWFMSPWKTLKHIIWKNYKWQIILGVLLVFFILFIAFTIYTAPSAIITGVIQAIL